MKHILIPTDFSNNAFKAFQYATQLFEKEACVFYVCHSFENQVSQLTSRVDIAKTESVVTVLYDETEAKCEEVIFKIKTENNTPNHSFKAIATSLSLFRAVNKLIKKEVIDFVVIGNKGSTNANDILMGSNALKMIEKVRGAALLVIPENSVFQPISNIAFATGFKRRVHEAELAPIITLAKAFNSSVRVLHMQQQEHLDVSQRLHYQVIIDLLKEVQPQANWLSTNEGIDKAISNYIDTASIGMLAMIYYKHNVFIQLFREATVKNLAKKSKIPFLIIPKHQ